MENEVLDGVESGLHCLQIAREGHQHHAGRPFYDDPDA
jgi:hypothetical protein